MDELTSRFLAAFRRLEAALAKSSKRDEDRQGFSTLLEDARNLPIIRSNLQKLRTIARLRNAIVHEDYNGKPIATPNADITCDLEKIASSIDSPRTIVPHFQRVVTVCSTEDSFAVAANKMLQNEFSQLPVFHEGELIGILTWETVARWLTVKFRAGGGVIEDEKCGATRPEIEKEHFRVVGRQTSIADAIIAFESSVPTGRPLQAILVTEHGRRRESLLSIITPADIPQMLATERS